LFNQKTDGIASPESKGKLQLVWSLVNDKALDFRFLFRSKVPLISMTAATSAFDKRFGTFILVALPNPAAMGFADTYNFSGFLVGSP